MRDCSAALLVATTMKAATSTFSSTFPEGTSLFDLVRIQRELEALLGLKVDLGTEVKPQLRERIEAEAIPLEGLGHPGEISQ